MCPSDLLTRAEPEVTPLELPAPVRRLPRTAPEGVSRRVRRNRTVAALLLSVLVVAGLWLGLRGGAATSTSPPLHRTHPAPWVNPRLASDWDGDGHPVTFAFGGDVNFPSGSTLGDRLAADPASALGAGVPQLLGGVDLSMANFESALTNGTCPDPAPKQYDFWAPPSAVTAFQAAGVTLVTEANNHGEDCGLPGLQTALAVRTETKYTILGIGQDAAQAFTPFETTIDGQHIGIIAATQVIDGDLQDAWSASDTQPGLASAYDVNQLIAAVQAARKVDDTVIVFLHWGIQLDACPDPIQEPLATALVRAGADIVIGSHAHVLLGGGYLGTALVDYGLGNFAFYNDPVPTNNSGSLVVTATGRRIDRFEWRPALIEDELPVPVSGAYAQGVLSDWEGARACTDLTVTPTAPLSTPASEVAPVPQQIAARLSIDS